ncbi:MAG: TIGR00730 family Rossman fold protein [Bryobacterales bacterium]|nr:TIGR00730 family Rossman fold protein [Bryobacterales bacterium]
MANSNPFDDGATCNPVAYKNAKFLDSRSGRAIRILSEYLQPLAHFRNERVQDTVVFFGSARIQETGPLSKYYHEARELARLVTEWSDRLERTKKRFVVTTGGGPGIMEAANRGAHDAGGKTIGLNIGLPFEQRPNPYITSELCFEFHYFFMRKFWFAYLAKALVVFPGGFGTLDELMEVLTLTQTRKLEKKMVTVLYGREFWQEILNFEALAKYGLISPEDLDLFQFADSPEQAFTILREGLSRLYLAPAPSRPGPEEDTPEIAKSRV